MTMLAEAAVSLIRIGELMAYLPHRYPFVLIDRIIEIGPGNRLVALKNICANEYFFEALPAEATPTMPNLLVLEALAQAAGVLTFVITDTRPEEDADLFFFAGAQQVRFERPAEIGDRLLLDVSLAWQKRGIWHMHATARVDEEVVCSAEVTLAKQGRK